VTPVLVTEVTGNATQSYFQVLEEVLISAITVAELGETTYAATREQHQKLHEHEAYCEA
jgi:hypothetical protein